MKKLLLLITILFVCFASCSDDDHNRGSRIVKAAIQDADYIYGNSQGNSRSGHSEASNFWTADKYGKIAPVQFITEKGDTLDLRISNVFDANDKYLMMVGNFSTCWESPSYTHLLTEKATGLIRGLPVIMSHPWNFHFYTDSKGNIYFNSFVSSEGYNMIFKADMSNPNNPQLIEYMPRELNPNNFSVNKNGVCCINPMSDDCKFKTPEGRIYTIQQLLSGLEETLKDIFIGFDGYNYLVTNKDSHQGIIIYKVLEDKNNELSISRILTYDTNFNMYNISFLPDHKNNVHIASNGERILTFNDQTLEIKELSIELPGTQNILFYPDSYYFTSDALYLKENSQHGIIHSFTKLNLNDYSVERVDFMGSGYEAYTVSTSIKVSKLSFSGLRFLDGKNVIGNVDARGNFSAYENIHLASKATDLIRLN